MESKAYHCDIVASKEGSLLAFPITKFRQGLSDDAAFRGVWMAALAAEIRRLRARNECLHLNRATDRVVHYLETEGVGGVVTLVQPLKAWATELGLTHEAVYRALALLEQQGRIRRHGNTVRIECMIGTSERLRDGG